MNRTDRRSTAKTRADAVIDISGFFYDNNRNCPNGNAYCKIHTIMRLGRILGPVSSFLICHFLYLCAICAWPSQSLVIIINTPLVHFIFFWRGGGGHLFEGGWAPIRGWALINFSYLQGGRLLTFPTFRVGVY